MIKLRYFRNDGFGWVCLNCERDIAAAETAGGHSRMFREGESESRRPNLANRALAKWADPAQSTLVCPLCGITERVDIA